MSPHSAFSRAAGVVLLSLSVVCGACASYPTVDDCVLYYVPYPSVRPVELDVTDPRDFETAGKLLKLIQNLPPVGTVQSENEQVTDEQRSYQVRIIAGDKIYHVRIEGANLEYEDMDQTLTLNFVLIERGDTPLPEDPLEWRTATLEPYRMISVSRDFADLWIEFVESAGFR